MEDSSHRYDWLLVQSVPLPSLDDVGAESSKLLTVAWSSWLPASFLKPSRNPSRVASSEQMILLGLHHSSKRISSVFCILVLCRLQILFKYSSFFRRIQNVLQMFTLWMALHELFLKHRAKGWTTSPGLLQLLFNTSNV